MAVGRWGKEEGRGRKTEVRSQESGVKSQESGVRSQESEGRRREGQGRTGARKCAVNPTQSDQIRPGSDESDRMKPVVDCKCAMAGVARWIGCIGRFTERRMAALDERFRLLTTSYVAGVGGYRLSTSFAACPHDFAPGIPCPSPVAGNSSAGAKDVAKTKPNVGRVQDWKTSFFSGNTNISIRPGVGCENMFLRNEPK